MKTCVEQKHTPKPWGLCDGGIDCLRTFIIATDKDGNDVQIAEMHCDDVDENEAGANAQLMISAPDLVDCLQELFDDWLTLTEQDASDGNKDVIQLTTKVNNLLNNLPSPRIN